MTERPFVLHGTHWDIAKDIDFGGNRKCFNLLDPINDQDCCTKAFHNANLPADQDLGIGKESDDIIHSNDIERTTTSSSYVKLKEIVSYKNLKGVRISVDLKTGNSPDLVYAKVCINDIIVGTEFSDTTGVYVTHSREASDVVYGDLIQIYVRRTLDVSAYVQNMKIKYMEFENNDP